MASVDTGSKKVALVVGASRGIGRQVAIDLAANGYVVVVAAKSTSDGDVYAPGRPFPPDPNSPQSTINTVEREIREAGGEAMAVAVDVRDYASVRNMVDQTVQKYGRLDVLIYNSGAIYWASVANTPMKRFRLMQNVNPEGLYATVQACLPHLTGIPTSADGSSAPPPLPSSSPPPAAAAAAAATTEGKPAPSYAGRIVVVCPPIYSRFFRGKTAYAMGKVGMSVLVKGLAMDIERMGLSDCAITGIWPATAIQSAATEHNNPSSPSSSSSSSQSEAELARLRDLRKPTIFSDAILAILRSPDPSVTVNGLLTLDEDFLRSPAGGGLSDEDFVKYDVLYKQGDKKERTPPRRIMPAKFPDLRVEEQDDEGQRMDSSKFDREKGKRKGAKL